MNIRQQMGICTFLAILVLNALDPVMAMDTQFSGFGTASVACFSSDAADFVINDQPKGAGRSGRCDAGVDSLLGLQLDLDLSDNLAFGLQLVSDRNADRRFTPDVTVAQLRWRPAESSTVRIGRTPTPAFLHSEDRQVRFAMPWVRPPLQVYGLLPTYSQDGVELIHEGKVGRWFSEWQGGVAVLAFDSPNSNSRDTTPVDSRTAYLNFSLRDRNALLKMGYGFSRTSVDNASVAQLLDALKTFGGSEGRDLADDLELDNSAMHRFNIGARYEAGGWLAMGEFGYRSIDSYFRDQYGAYVTLGRHFESWMPYTTLARRWTRGPDSDSRAGSLQPQVEGLLAATRYDNTSVTLGLSRAIGEQATLKFQVDWIRADDQSWGLYTNHSPTAYDYANPGVDRLYTLSLDFVF